jgi:hypothetical protein
MMELESSLQQMDFAEMGEEMKLKRKNGFLPQ